MDQRRAGGGGVEQRTSFSDFHRHHTRKRWPKASATAAFSPRRTHGRPRSTGIERSGKLASAPLSVAGFAPRRLSPPFRVERTGGTPMQPVSPLEEEMPGRAEGRDPAGCDARHEHPPLSASPTSPPQGGRSGPALRHTSSS